MRVYIESFDSKVNFDESRVSVDYVGDHKSIMAFINDHVRRRYIDIHDTVKDDKGNKWKTTEFIKPKEMQIS